MNAAEYLARVGFDHLLMTRLGGPTVPEWVDEDDQAGVDAAAEIARLADHERVRQMLIDPDAKPMPRAGDLTGARWLMVLTWPDRIPSLKPWAGRSTLPQIITQRRTALSRRFPDELAGRIDLLSWSSIPRPEAAKRVKAKVSGAPPVPPVEDMREGQGHSGIDALCCQGALDLGFSPDALDLRVAYRPALELLAIIGIETVPLVSYGPRECGFLHDGRAWRFAVEERDGGYRYRWGEVREYRPADRHSLVAYETEATA